MGHDKRLEQPDGARRGLPLRGGQQQPQSQRTHARITIAHHLVFTGYGHWLPNDLRGSGSTEIRSDALLDLGPILPGRQRNQPSRADLRGFYRKATPLLEQCVFWFDAPKRQPLAEAFALTTHQCGYTVWACAVCSNHAHMIVRRHRDDVLTIWDAFADRAREGLRKFLDVDAGHPVWADRPYKVFLHEPEVVRDRIGYVNDNPGKEGRPRQKHAFVKPYDGWPYRGK